MPKPGKPSPEHERGIVFPPPRNSPPKPPDSPPREDFPEGWKLSSVKLLDTKQKKHKVMCWVEDKGLICIDLRKIPDRGEYWTVSHVKTGHWIASFLDRDEAIQFASTIKKLAWRVLSLGGKEEIKEKVDPKLLEWIQNCRHAYKLVPLTEGK